MNLISSLVYPLLVAIAICSLTLVLSQIQCALSFAHRERLRLLKLGIFATWIAPVLTVLLKVTNVSVAIGDLIPQSASMQQALTVASRSTLPFDEHSLSWISLLSMSYLVAVTFMLFRLMRSYLKLQNALCSSTAVNLSGTPVRINNEIHSPFCFGFMNPQIFLPAHYLTSKTPSELNLVVAHETTHIRNRDPQWKLISLITKCFLFFFPASWLLHQRLELEMEIICDELTMRETRASVAEYGRVLIDVAQETRKAIPNPEIAYMSENNLSRRIRAMKAKTSFHPVLSAALSAVLVMGAVTTLATTSASSKLANRYFIKADIKVDGKPVAAPQFLVAADEPAYMEAEADDISSTLKMDLTASEYSSDEVHDGIALRMALEYVNHGRVLRAHPHVVIKKGENAIVKMDGETDGVLEMVISTERR